MSVRRGFAIMRAGSNGDRLRPSYGGERKPVAAQTRNSREEAEIHYGRRIITSVDLINAAAVSPFLRRISRTASAVTIDVIFWPPMERVIWAINPSILMSVTRPIN